MAKLRCDGWWEQEGYGRQPMTELVIDFVDGRLSGSGTDIVGDFDLIGSIEGDQIAIQKHYIGAHTIDYFGTTDGEGVFFGQWSSFGMIGGNWSIRFRALDGGNGFGTITPISESPDDAGPRSGR